MSNKHRHSFIAFYPSDWLAGTSRMTRLVKSVYFDVCVYNWEKAEAVPESEMVLMFADLEGQGEVIINALVKSKKLVRDDDGGVYNVRALEEAQKAFSLWKAKSDGGKAGKKTGEKPASVTKTPSTLIKDKPKSAEENQNVELRDSSNEESGNPPSGEVFSPGENDPIPEPDSPIIDEGGTAKNEAIVTAWNDMARKHGLTQVAKMTGERPKRLKVRISEHGVAAIVTGINTIPDSPFLMGKNDRGWKANFDWLVQPASCSKLIEGGYHNDGEGVSSAWRN